MPQRRILVVENESSLAREIQDYFETSDPKCAVTTVNSVGQALQGCRDTHFDVLYTAYSQTGEIDGLRLLEEIRKSDIPIRVIIGADPELSLRRADAVSFQCDSFLVKPFGAERLCRLILSMLGRQQGFRGRLIGMRLEDLIQMYCYGKDTVAIFVSKRAERGAIYVHGGQVVHAEWQDLTGVDAFCEILGWRRGEFVAQVMLDAPERTVFKDWQGLLMEGIRERDEIRHALGPEVSQEIVTPIQAPAEGASTVQSGDADHVKRIMIVDDSRFIRKIVQEIVQADPELTVVGYASNGQEALAKLEELRPNVILLDWDMPVMKGSTALMHIMIKSPCPVVVLSGFVGGVGANPFDLICLGAVDFMRKPQSNWRTDGRARDMIRRIKQACDIKFDRIRRVRVPTAVTGSDNDAGQEAPLSFLTVVGSSTGGCADLIRIVPMLPANLASAVVCLHDMQPLTIGAFADYLNERSGITVKSVESGDALENGVCYIHPSTVPLEITKETGVPVFRVPTNVPGDMTLDHFLISAVGALGGKTVAILLSGGPDKGLDGLRAVREANGRTLALDPLSSVDPRIAEQGLELGVVERHYPADRFAETLEQLIGG